MRQLTAVVLLSAVASSVVSRGSLRAADEKPSTPSSEKQPENPRRAPKTSDKAVVQDIVYGLEEDSKRLCLTSQPLNGDDRELKRVELKFVIPPGGEIDELSLAKMDGKNLMAVVKIHRGEEYEFHCLTFIGPSGGGHVHDNFAFHKAKFFTTRDNLKILAVGGKHFGGSVFIVLGDIEPDEEQEAGTLTEGIFYFNGCPWPPSGGALSPFRVKSVPSKGTGE